MLQATCPYCGQLANYREISIGTITRCKCCNQKYIYPEIPEPIIFINQSTYRRRNDNFAAAIMFTVFIVVAIVASCLLILAVHKK